VEKKLSVRGYLYVIISAVIYGCMPLMAKFIYMDGVNAITLVFLRNVLALPALAALAYGQAKTLKVNPKALPKISLVALFGCCVTPLLLFSSYVFISSGTATVLHFIYPAIVVVLGVIFLRERVSGRNLTSVILCAVGICLFYDPQQTMDWRGALLAAGSGLTFAVYVVLLPKSKKHGVTGLLLSFYIAVVSSVLMLILCLVSGQMALPSTLGGWGLCLLFAMAVTAGAVVLFQQGTFLIGGQRASVLSTLEPITGVVVGAIVFQEAFTFGIAAGTVLVVLASILIAMPSRKKADT